MFRNLTIVAAAGMLTLSAAALHPAHAGLGSNGTRINGLGANGLTSNGLTGNGLTQNGIRVGVEASSGRVIAVNLPEKR